MIVSGLVNKHPWQLQVIPISYCIHDPGVPGHPLVDLPEEDQLFQVELLEIAPSPIPLIPKPGKIPLQTANDPANATLSITLSAVLESGKHDDPVTYTVPFRTTAFGEHGHISIRESGGSYVDYMTYDGRYDVLADCELPSMFVGTGTWTFEIVAKLGDETCLFALSLTQWLEGLMLE
ncbi:hypothetical protein CHU98_g10597 [Xylaria longipes]|nr:hypothetical protein CHU98_g10597 [Xylaria longipes]